VRASISSLKFTIVPTAPRTSVTLGFAAAGARLRRAILIASALSLAATLGPLGIHRAEAACGSFQARVNNASRGSTIRLPRGCRYRESVTIRKPLTILAHGAVVDGQNRRRFGVLVLADDVRIFGLTVTRAAGGPHDGAVNTTGVSRFLFADGRATNSATVCISLNGGSGHRVLRSKFHGCGKEGYFANGIRDSRFVRNRIHHNNTRGAWDPQVEAGGGKIMASRGITFARNRVHHNGGPGIWFDNDVRRVVVRNNRVWANDQAGIFFEISNGAKISGNKVWRNGFGHGAWGWGAGIQISSSDNAKVFDNIVAWNDSGISVISQARQYRPHDGNVVRDNVIISASGSYVAGFYDDHGGSLFHPSRRNLGYRSRYWIGRAQPSSERFHWRGPRSTLAAFNSTPGESSGKYISKGRRDRILRAASIPLRP
jgi:hypothetical protein